MYTKCIYTSSSTPPHHSTPGGCCASLQPVEERAIKASPAHLEECCHLHIITHSSCFITDVCVRQTDGFGFGFGRVAAPLPVKIGSDRPACLLFGGLLRSSYKEVDLITVRNGGSYQCSYGVRGRTLISSRDLSQSFVYTGFQYCWFLLFSWFFVYR